MSEILASKSMCWKSDSLYAQEFLPLTERIASEQPELSGYLDALCEKIGEKDFEKYIQNLVALKKAGKEVFLITERSMQRSLIEHMLIPALKEVFAVDTVRVISQK